jgi:hypothetical protein
MTLPFSFQAFIALQMLFSGNNPTLLCNHTKVILALVQFHAVASKEISKTFITHFVLIL